MVLGVLGSPLRAGEGTSRSPTGVPDLRKDAMARTTPQPPYQTPVNFSHPPRQYEAIRVRQWSVLVERQLMAEDANLAKRALARLDKQLGELLVAFPKSAHARLQSLTLFLMHGEKARGGGRDNGLEYFQKDAPQHHKHLDPRMGSSILIYSAANYVWLSEPRALKALAHEFAHAQHLEQWPETHPEIYDAWQRAMRRRLYRNVRDETGNLVTEGYAAVNQLEYFAELSMVYFVGGNHHPLDRSQLRAYDPDGYSMVEKLWEVNR